MASFFARLGGAAAGGGKGGAAFSRGLQRGTQAVQNREAAERSAALQRELLDTRFGQQQQLQQARFANDAARAQQQAKIIDDRLNALGLTFNNGRLQFSDTGTDVGLDRPEAFQGEFEGPLARQPRFQPQRQQVPQQESFTALPAPRPTIELTGISPTGLPSFGVSKPREITEKTLTSLSEVPDIAKGIEDSLNSLNQLKSGSFKSLSFGERGPIGARLKDINPFEARSKAVDAQIRVNSQVFGKFLEGGVLRKEDEEKYFKIFPQRSDLPQVARYKAQVLKRMLAQKNNSVVKSLIQSGRDPRGLKIMKVPKLPSIGKKFEAEKNQIDSDFAALPFRNRTSQEVTDLEKQIAAIDAALAAPDAQ